MVEGKTQTPGQLLLAQIVPGVVSCGADIGQRVNQRFGVPELLSKSDRPC